MFTKITNPETGKKVNINSKIGKNILKKYLSILNKSGGSNITGTAVIVSDNDDDDDDDDTLFIEKVRNDPELIKCRFHSKKSGRNHKKYLCKFKNLRLHNTDIRNKKNNTGKLIGDFMSGYLVNVIDDHFSSYLEDYYNVNDNIFIEILDLMETNDEGNYYIRLPKNKYEEDLVTIYKLMNFKNGDKFLDYMTSSQKYIKKILKEITWDKFIDFIFGINIKEEDIINISKLIVDHINVINKRININMDRGVLKSLHFYNDDEFYKMPIIKYETMINEIKILHKKLNKQKNKYLKHKKKFIKKNINLYEKIKTEILNNLKNNENYRVTEIINYCMDYYTFYRMFTVFDAGKKTPLYCKSPIMKNIIYYAGNSHITKIAAMIENHFNIAPLLELKADNKILKITDYTTRKNAKGEIVVLKNHALLGFEDLFNFTGTYYKNNNNKPKTKFLVGPVKMIIYNFKDKSSNNRIIILLSDVHTYSTEHYKLRDSGLKNYMEIQEFLKHILNLNSKVCIDFFLESGLSKYQLGVRKKKLWWQSDRFAPFI